MCPVAELAFPHAEAPCPAIRLEAGKALCGLVEVERLAGLDGMVGRVIGIGCGCSMPDDDTTDDEIEAFDKHSYITVYGPNEVEVTGGQGNGNDAAAPVGAGRY